METTKWGQFAMGKHWKKWQTLGKTKGNTQGKSHWIKKAENLVENKWKTKGTSFFLS